MNKHAVLSPNGSSPARLIAQVINGLLKGQLNNQLAVTLRTSNTTTVLTDPRLGVESGLHLTPLSAAASTAEKAGIWVSSRATGTMTLTHASNAAVDQLFQASIVN